MPQTSGLAARLVVAAGQRRRRRLLRRAAVRRRGDRSDDRRRRWQGCAGGAADVEPAGRGSRLRAGRRIALVRLHQREPAVVPQHGERPLRHLLLRPHRRCDRTSDLRERRAQPAAPRSCGRQRSKSCRRGARSSAFSPRAPTNRESSRCAPGDRLVFYTDGITEGRNAAGEEYGEEPPRRLRPGVIALPTPTRCSPQVLRDVESFNGGTYEDDATLIVAAL